MFASTWNLTLNPLETTGVIYTAYNVNISTRTEICRIIIYMLCTQDCESTKSTLLMYLSAQGLLPRLWATLSYLFKGTIHSQHWKHSCSFSKKNLWIMIYVQGPLTSFFFTFKVLSKCLEFAQLSWRYGEGTIQTLIYKWMPLNRDLLKTGNIIGNVRIIMHQGIDEHPLRSVVGSVACAANMCVLG